MRCPYCSSQRPDDFALILTASNIYRVAGFGSLCSNRMDQQKIVRATERLERNLPIRQNQAALPPPLRALHQRILRYYLEHGEAPSQGDVPGITDWRDTVERLVAAHVIVTDNAGTITGAYPFTSEERDFRLTTVHGGVRAMCAFDALAVSSMFGLPVRIESRCRVSRTNIVIQQRLGEIAVVVPARPVFAAIDWHAAAGAACCAATLCTEMVFIAGEENAAEWRAVDPEQRELFTLEQAHAFIAVVFVPLMQ